MRLCPGLLCFIHACIVGFGFWNRYSNFIFQKSIRKVSIHLYSTYHNYKSSDACTLSLLSRTTRISMTTTGTNYFLIKGYILGEGTWE